MIIKFHLFVLFAFILSSLVGISALPFFSVILWLGIFYLSFKKIKPGSEHFVGLGIFFISLVVTLPWFHDLILAPSNDDTINHLGFVQAILNSHHSLLGKILRPGSNFFGESYYHFYPSGSHALVALWIYPATKLFSLEWVTLYKIVSVIMVALWPVALWRGSLIAFPKISSVVRLSLVTFAATLPIFPLWPLGEGGLPRIFGLVIFTPFWFEAISKTEKWRTGFLWTALFAPVLLSIHPTTLPFIGVAAFFFSRRAFMGALVGSVFGGLLFYAVIHSAQQEVTQATFIFDLLDPIRHSQPTEFALWFDRLKGPVHYWLTDPYGFGKFLSPKNWLVYLGLFYAIRGTLSRKLILLFAVPFVLSAISLIPFKPFDQLGLIFYHSVKRISELTPLIGFTLALYAATRLNFNLWKKTTLAALSVIAVILYYQRAPMGLTVFHESFLTPTHSKYDPIIQTIRNEIKNDLLIIDRHDFDVVRFAFNQPVYTLKPECAEVGNTSDYCTKRKDWKNSILTKENPAKVWWIPSREEDEAAVISAQQSNRKTIELFSGAHLIQAI